ncbi:MAG: nuclease-related domain-containing protein [Oligoflexales bacterium]
MFAEKLAWINKAQKKFLAEESDQAGELGERLAYECLQGVLKDCGRGARLFNSVRVPKPNGSGKYEIDIILVSRAAVLVIEVKHWGGALEKHADGWTQTRGQGKKTFQDPIGLNQEKTNALGRWLEQRDNLVSSSAIHSMVVLTNPQVELGARLQKETSVLPLSTLADVARFKCALPKRKFFQKKRKEVFDFNAVIASLELLPTWDRVRFHGGKLCYGDLDRIVLSHLQPSTLVRKSVQSAKVVMSRRVFPGIFLKPKLRIKDWAGKKKSYPLDPDAKMIFQLAGQAQKEEIPFVHVEALDLGWKDFPYKQ